MAAQRAGFHEVPVVITEADDLKSLEFAIVENVQRNDLNPLEEALGYKRLIDEFSYDQEKVSKFIGKSRSYITNTLRLLNLPEEVLGDIDYINDIEDIVHKDLTSLKQSNKTLNVSEKSLSEYKKRKLVEEKTVKR